MKQGSTLFLKGVVTLIGAAVLAICIFALPLLIKSELRGDFDYGYIFLGLYITAIPFFFALYQAIKLLNYIDQNKAFSELSVKALKNIKYCAVIISALFVIGMPYIFYVGDRDDAPGVVALGFVIIFSSIVIATFAAVLQKLLQNAAEIKSENDLMI
ncbi:TPA: DUF2975 domain-containing protein [Candidatus Nomurabacteria bacterium]|nr:DUF2975 domain-containing protein [Candidatus Nomurabacteria bacterium]